MKTAALILMALAVALAGCTSKSKARAGARAAFYAGQAKALESQLMPALPPRAPGNTVAILGPVNFPSLKWGPGMTLIKTIVAAEYTPPGEPKLILITRNGSQFPVNPADLLNGQDIPLLPGDVVELKP